MLDTNTASYIIKGRPVSVREQLAQIPMGRVCISVITEAELLHGVVRNPEAKHLPQAIKTFLLNLEVLPWNSDAAEAYAYLRASCEKQGKSLSAMDMLIAAHSMAVDAILVTSDKAFYRIQSRLSLKNWVLTKDH